MKTGRNSACTCGSGLKYKQCCGQNEGKSSPVIIIVALVIGALIVGGAIFVSKDNNQQPSAAVSPAAPATPAPQAPGVPNTPQPPGPAPAGKVWNVEHGHWHDAPGVTAAGAPAVQPSVTPGAAAQPSFTPAPQPPGPAPAGKVWSAEHGHWHDAPK